MRMSASFPYPVSIRFCEYTDKLSSLYRPRKATGSARLCTERRAHLKITFIVILDITKIYGQGSL